MRGHGDIVNAVKFFPSRNGWPRILLSGSADKTIRVWRIELSQITRQTSTTVLEGHNNSINCLSVCSGKNLVASGSADATIKIWRLDFTDDVLHFELSQTIQILPRFFPLALALHRLGSSNDLVLATAGTKNLVQIFVAPSEGQFGLQATLLGHEGWIRSLSISWESESAESDLLLASASQDKYIRLWRIARYNDRHKSDPKYALPVLENSLSNKTHRLRTSDSTYSLTFEALLLGHEDWIYTVAWRLDGHTLQLLSASADNSLAIWACEQSSGVWVCTTRLGEISSQKGSTTATGSAGGFWIGAWSPTGDSIASLSRTGSWRFWSHERDSKHWTQRIGISGHTKPVNAITWSKAGTYLLSVGSDQTTRLHAEWKRGANCSWHEMARPQIHGYDLNCIDSISETQFISGADEKLLRVFDEPCATADLLDSLCGTQTDSKQKLPDAASMPVLGLSNKAAEELENDDPDRSGDLGSEQIPYTEPTNHGRLASVHPPLEDQLTKLTLWPEKEKLYGHGYEICAVAVSQDGNTVATSCRASSVDQAVIRLYNTSDWREIRPVLVAHSLTATALKFSKDDRYILSVGRDRQWVIFERDLAPTGSYLLKYSNAKGHSRMILDACWGPTEVGVVFATAGRDKTVKIWEVEGEIFNLRLTMTVASPVTAVDIAPMPLNGCLLLAAGTEMGEIFFYHVDNLTWSIKQSCKLPDPWVNVQGPSC